MIIETTHKFNQFVKRVEFFPYEWAANLLAVCFSDSVKIFTYNESANPSIESSENKQKDSSKLSLLVTVPFDQKIDNFNWSPRTHISSIKPSLNFALNDFSQNVIFYTINLSNFDSQAQHHDQSSINQITSSIKKEKFDVECIYNIAFDHQNGDLVAFTADNYCYLWDYVESRLRATFQLQSPGINICWHRDEKSKFMVGEKGGTIRIYSIDMLKPVFSLTCINHITRELAYPILSFDWSQFNPEIIVACTNTDIYVWNTSRSSLPEKIIDSHDNLKSLKFSHFKENVFAFKDGNDACAKLVIMNHKSNQVIYQSKNMKLLESYSFNPILPIVAISNEQNLIITKIIN